MESPWGDIYYTDYSELPLCILQLDPADRAVIRIADERDAVQKKTFTKWVNKHLLKAGRKILDLYEDLRDGHNLISLLEVLAHDILPRERGHMRFHKIQNVQIALDFLRMKGIKLVNIRSDEIVDGNPKLTLGLIWTIILHFQISDVVVPGQEDITAKDALLLWSRRTAEGYPGVKIRDFSSSWRDGKAFLSILHRNRPDLVDIRQMRQNNNKQNLESAFHIAEKEFGVTRLLDVDDVDVPNPDEKSIITYVSSLYDVFPEVPSVEQSLRDNERQLKVEEYKELASSLLAWLRDYTKLMLSRNYPTTLIEMKALLSDFNRFRTEEVPSQLELRNRALRLFDEIQSLTTDPSHMSIEDEFLPHIISRMWSRFEASMQERDMTLQAEVIRLERLQRLVEKAHRDIRYCEETLANLSQTVDDTAQGLDLMHAYEARRNYDALDRGLKNVEESLRGLFRDCQTLQDGGHPQAEQLYRRVCDLQNKVSSLRNHLHSQVMRPLLGRPVDEGMTKSRVEMVSESRLMEKNPAFRHVQSCLEWVDAKQRQLDGAKFDTDLSQVLAQLNVHKKEHEEIQLFRSRLDKCISDRATLSPEEQKLYTQNLSKLEVAYSLLSKTSSRHLRCLESLSEFLQLATAELQWLSEREDIELSRDWGAWDLNLPELEEYHKSLVRQMESRESQFNTVQEKGGAMILDRHPSARTVEAFMSTLQSQWSWLVHLSWCLEAQVKHCADHKNFFEEVQHCEQWMACHSELLQNKFSSDNIPIDQAQVLLADLQALQDQIREYDRRVSSLVVKSREIIPLKLRSQRVTGAIRVRTLCACHQQDMSLQRGEECFLVNNSQRTKWKVKTMTGLEANVPSACLLIPPPNQEAIDAANRLKLQHERLSTLWKSQHRKVRIATINAAIKQVKGWDLKKFLSMEPAQREAVWHALKVDGEKLIAEFGTSDRDMRRLAEELRQCEQIYKDLCEQAAAKEGRRGANLGQVILNRVESVSRELTLTDQQLLALLHRPVPQNNLAVQESFRSYREIQLKFDKLESEIRMLQTEVKELPSHNSNIQSKLNLVVQKAEQMKVISHIYVDRLKGCEVVITGLNEVKQLVADFESSLAAHDNMTSDLSELKSVKNELVSLQESLQQHQPKLQHLKEDVEALRALVERSRPGSAKHHDVDGVEKEVRDLTKRWDQVCIQVVERLHSVSSCQDLLSLYHNGLHAEQTWASQMEKRISSQPSLNGDVTDAKQQLEPTMAIYNALGDRRYQIESVNRHGGQFIREAKISDVRLKQFKDSIGETSGLSRMPDSKKFKKQDGSEVVKDELDRLNKLYMEMVDWANTRLKQITGILSAHGEMQFQVVVDEEMPLLRTFRAELAKRSSLLVDTDMREYFTQQFDGPTPSQVSYGITPEQLYKSTLQIRPESSTVAGLPEVTKIIRLQPKSKRGEDITSGDSNRSSLSELSMTLQAMESSSTLLPAAAASSKNLGPSQQYKCHQQTVVIIKKEEIIPRGQVLHVFAVLNPYTSQKVTLVEALQSGLIDTKTKTFVDPSTRQRLPLPQAARKGYIDEVLLKQLTAPCGSQDPQTGLELSLIEAIQKNLYDPVTNTFTDSTAGEPVSISEAVARGIISESCSRILAGEKVEITSITHTQALFANSEPIRMDTGLSLGIVLEKGLCSEITGKVTDPVTGGDMSIMEAVEKGYINPSYQEIKEAATGNYITLMEAVAAGFVDPFKGTYQDRASQQKIPLSAAMSKGLVKAATSLADVVSEGNLTENGQVFDPISGQVMSFSEACESGIISSDKKCILDSGTDKILSVKEAVAREILTPAGLFVSPEDNSQHPILEALKIGIVKLVHEDIQFSKTGVKDPRTSEVVTLFEALKRGILTPQGSYIDQRTGREMSLQQAANAGLVDRNLMKDLNKPTSMKDSRNRNISIAEALRLGIVDTETGCFENIRTKERLMMQEATSVGLITASDAVNILSLLSPLMTSTTVLSQIESPHTAEALTVKQAISQGYLNENTGLFRDPKTGRLIPLEEAIKKGLLKLSSEWPVPSPLGVSTDEPDSVAGKVIEETFMTDTKGDVARTIPIEPGSKRLESSFMSKTGSQYSFTTTMLAKPLLMHSGVAESRHINLKSVTDPRTGRELDIEDAIKRQLINLDKNQYTHPITGETMSINTAIERGLIKAELMGSGDKDGAAAKETRVFSIVGLLHPHTGKCLSVSQAVKEGILDQAKGLYNNIDSQGNLQPMKISEAIDKGLVLVEDIGDFSVGPDSLLRETKSYILKTVVHPVTGKHMSIADAIAEGIINESEGLYINPNTGEAIPIHTAIERGLIIAQLTSVNTDIDRNVNKITTTKMTTLSVTAVVDPRTGQLISVAKAIEEGILNQSLGTYTDPQTGESVTLMDAIDKRLVLAKSPESDDPLEKAEISSIHITDEQESHEATLVEDIHSETLTMTITSVVDPKTMELVSYDEAVKMGILNVKQGTYLNPSTRDSMPITAALEMGLIHGEVTSKRRDEDIMRSSVSAASPAFPIKDITSVLDPRTGKVISFDKAVKDGIINPDRGTYINLKTGAEVSLAKAKDLGYLKESKQSTAAQLVQSLQEEDMLQAQLQAKCLPGESDKPWSTVEMELEKTMAHDKSLGDGALATEVLHYSTDIENDNFEKLQATGKLSSRAGVPANTSGGVSYKDALKLGLVNPDTGKVRDPTSGELLTLKEAVDRGVIDAFQPALQEPTSGQVWSLKECLDKNIIDPKAGKVNIVKAKQAGFSEPSMPQRTDAVQAFNIIDAVRAGLFNPDTGKFTEPQTGQLYTLQEGLNKSIIEGDLVTVKDTTSGIRIPLATAVRKGLISGSTAEVRDIARKVSIDLPLAIERQLVKSSLDTELGTVIDPQTGEQISLRQAITDGDLKSDSVMILDSSTGKQVPMDEALKRGLVDRSGSVVDKRSGKKLSPQEALKTGLMVIIGAPVLAGKMVVDAVRDRSRSPSRTPYSTEAEMESTRSQSSPTRTSVRETVLSKTGTTKFGYLENEEINESPVHIDVQKGPKSPTVGVVGKPVTITIDPGSTQTAKATTNTFQQKLSHKTSQDQVASLSRTDADTSTGLKETVGSKGFSHSQPVSPSSDPHTKTSKRPGPEDAQTSLYSKMPGAESKMLKEASVKDVEINWETGTVTDKLSGHRMTVVEAVQKGLIDSDIIEILATNSTQPLHTSPDWEQGTPTNLYLNTTLKTTTKDIRYSTDQAGDTTPGQGLFVDETLNRNIDSIKSSLTGPSPNLSSPDRSSPVSISEAFTQGVHDSSITSITTSRASKQAPPVAPKPRSPVKQQSNDGATLSQEQTESYGKRSPARTTADEDYQHLDSSSQHRIALLDSIKDQLADSSPGTRGEQGLSFTQAINSGQFDDQRGIFHDTNTGEDLSFQEAIDSGKLDGKVTLYNRKSGESYSLEKGLKEGKIDPVTGEFIDEKGRKMSIKEAAKLGLLAVVGAPIVAAMVAKEALSELMDGKGSRSSETNNNGIVFQERSARRLTSNMLEVNETQDNISDIGFGDSKTVHQALPTGYQDPKSLHSAGEATFSRSSEKIQVDSVYDPSTGQDIPLDEAVNKNIVHLEDGTYENSITGERMPISQAMSDGLISGQVIGKQTTKMNKTSSLVENVFEKEHSEKLKSKAETFRDNIQGDGIHNYREAPATRGSVGHDLTDSKNRSEAMKQDGKHVSVAAVYDPLTGSRVGLEEAIERRLVDESCTTFTNPVTGRQMTVEDAMREGLVTGSIQTISKSQNVSSRTQAGTYNITGVLDTKTGREVSVEEAISKGILDPSGKYTDSVTGEQISLAEAMKHGFVISEKISQPNKLVADQRRQGEYITFKEAMRRGLIDPNAGTFSDEYTGKIYSVDEAVRTGSIVASDGRPFEYKRISETGVTYSFRAALQMGIIDSETCLFYDSLTGDTISIEAALEEGYLSPIAGAYGGRAIGSSVVMLKDGVAPSPASSLDEILDSKTGEKLSLPEAEKRGLVSVVRQNNKMSLKEAVQSGLVDSNTGLFHDPLSGETLPIDQAVLCGLIAVDEGSQFDSESDRAANGYHNSTEAMNIAAAISQGYMDTATATFTDPFTQESMSVSQAIRKGLLQPSLTLGDSDGHILPATEGRKDISEKLQKSQGVTSSFGQDAVSGPTLTSGYFQSDKIKTGSTTQNSLPDDTQSHYPGRRSTTPSGGRHTPIERATSQDRASTPGSPGRMADSYDKLVQDMSMELQRLQSFQQTLKEDSQMGAEVEEIQNQLESHIALHEEMLSHQQPILSLVYQAEQLTELYQEELTPQQVTFLTGEAAGLKKALEKVIKTSDRRLKHLKTAVEELSKLEAEMTKFNSWKSLAKSELFQQEERLKRFEDLQPLQNAQKELMTDILSHQADMRFMSISVQKYMEEAKLHKLEVDSFRADRQRPARSSLISMDCVAVDIVKDKLKDVTDDYADLKHRCSAFGDHLSDLSSKQRGFNDAAFKMLSWLAETEDELASISEESSIPDPDKLHGQLDRIKSLSNEVLNQSALMDEVRKKGHELTHSLDGLSADRDQVEKLEKDIEEIDARYASVNDSVSAQARLLQMSITQSKDIQGAISDIKSRLDSAQVALASQQPVSLELPIIAEQEKQFRIIAADVNSYKDSIESIRETTRGLIKSGELQLARALEKHLADIEDQFKQICDSCQERSSALRDVSGKLGDFHDKLDATHSWFQAKSDDLQSGDVSSLPSDEAMQQLNNIISEKKKKEKDIVELKGIAKDLLEDQRTGSPASLNKAISDLEKAAAQFDAVLSEKQADISQKERQSNEFELAKTVMLLWLAQMEARVDEFEPAAIEVDIVEKQIAELQPMLVEYEEQGPKVDEVNDLGNALEALTSSGDRPLSPVRRTGRTRRIQGLTSPRLPSPSPTAPLSPTAMKTSLSSESSGVSSRKSSSDNLLLDDLSPTQQQLLDINQRYEILGERLADRQQELQNVLASLRVFLQDMQELLSWLDTKDAELSTSAAAGIPANEKAAKKKLKEHEEFHRELLNKEGLVEDIRKKAQELLKSRPGVPGLDTLQSQLTDLDEKWHGLRAMSEERRKGLEDAVSSLRDFREHEDQLSRWFNQKEKLMDVLGPVAMEPSLLRSQMEQVKVLKEEFASQEPTYEQFINSGHAILDWCDASTSDSSIISKHMDAVTKSWNKLQGRLKEREKNIESVQGLSGEFTGVARELANWLGEFNDRIDSLPKVSSQPDRQQAQKLELQNLQQEMQDKLPQIAKAKDLCQQLCDTTKDLSTKTDLKAKMAALDKDINDTIKKLESRAYSIEEASKAGQEFSANCKQMLDWIQNAASTVTDAADLTTDADLLQKQALNNKTMIQELNLKEGEIRSLLDKGNKFIHEASPTAETRAIKETLTCLENEWGELKEAVKGRDEKIKAASADSQAFQQNLDKMIWWLGTAEERLKRMSPECLDKASIAAKLKELHSLQNEFLKKSHDHDSFNKTAESLLQAVTDTSNDLHRQVEEINRRWNAVNSGLTEQAGCLEDLQSHLAEVEDNKTDIKHSLTRWEDKLAAHMDMGTAARDPKYIDKIKAMQDDITGVQSQLDYVDTLVEEMNLDDDIDSSELKHELKSLKFRYDQLQNEVGELLSNMEAGSSIVGQFQDMMKRVAGHLSDLGGELSSMKPVSRDERELDVQLQEIKNFKTKLSDKSEPLVDLKDQARDLQLAGFVSDPDGLNNQVETLLNQQGRLKDKTDQRMSEIEFNRDRVQKVGDDLKILRRKIDDAVATVDSMNPIGSTANQIKEQQAELKKFSKSQLEPLQKELDNLNFEIQALIKSAPSGVNTGSIEEDIEALQERWSELSEKVSERDRALDKALLQSGKFKEALASLLQWMVETEESMAGQRPASPEFRVVKAQLQEQKLLQKMIDDRAPSVASVKETGKQIISGLSGAERDSMDKEIKSLDKRWAALTGAAAERMKMLEEMSDLAKQFQDIHEPLAAWLDSADKKFASLEPKSPNAGGIEKLIHDLKILQKEIAEHESPVKQLASVGKKLQEFCKGEDVVLVQVKIDEMQKSFSDLKNKVDDSLEQMEEALPLAKNFQDAHEKFVEWVAKVEPELRGKELSGADAEEKVQGLMDQLEAIQPYLEVINNEGAELAEIASGDAGFHVEDVISKDNRRYEGVRQQIEKQADKMKMSRQRSLECINELDDLLEWFDQGEDKLSGMQPISAEPGTLQKQLAEAKTFADEINKQKSKARDAITSGKKLVRDSSKEDVGALVEKMDQLKNKCDAVGSLATERLSELEQALPLARSFHETHDNLVSWLDELEPALAELEITAVDANQVRKQQESIKALKKDVADHKPAIDRLNKSGSALVQLLSPDEAEDIQNKLDEDNKRIDDVRNGVRERSNSIDAAMQQSAEFTDKLEDMLETLTSTAETIQNAEPISAHPGKIREQIEENKIVGEDMQMKSDALESVKEAADELIRQAGNASDPAVREVRQKLEELTRLYSDIQNNCHDRDRALEDALAVSEKFWEDLNTLSGNIKELQDGFNNQEKPALEPEAIREQQEELEAFREDLAASHADLEDLQETGDQLMSLVGDPERPEVRKNLDDTEQSLNNIGDQVEKRAKDLDAILCKAVTFQEHLQKLLVWIQKQEDTFNNMEPIADDVETIQSQWNDIKVFKGIVDCKHVEVEALNQLVEELTRDSTAEQASVVTEPVKEVNQRWDSLQMNIRDRQRDIQVALLNLGQFDQAYTDFKSWLDSVDNTLEELEPVYGDPKMVELELAKLRIVTNDIAAHQDSLDSLSEAAGQLMTKEKAPEASKLKKKMEDLVKEWERVKDKAAKRQSQLEDARREARGFTEELQDILMKIGDLDGQMITSQPTGGLPETAKEQLEKFMTIFEDIEKLEPAVESLQLMSEKLATKSRRDPASSIRQNVANLQQRFDHAKSRAADRKKKLEDAVGLAGNFHEELNKFIGWLTDTEKTLNNLQPVSRLVDRVIKQIEDHRVLQKDVSSHREAMFALDKMGTHLKYFSQKQDVVLIKNLLSSVQHRWEKIVSRSAERTRHLEKGYKEAKQFYDSWKDLIQWLTEADAALNSDTSVSNEPEKIRTQIAKHKEFQRRLGAKQPVYDSINRTGSTLQSRCPDDKPALQALLTDLKNKWNAVCGKSVDRQRKLEEGLLFTGQFNEALEALLDWLVKMEPTLAEDTPVHGDLDTVTGFMEVHKAFQQELGARATTVQFVRKSAKDLIEKSSEDMSHVQSQLIELSTLWDRTCKLSVSKQERLEQALGLAEEFHGKAQGLLDWLADTERQLRFKGAIPDEEALIVQQIEDHKKFEESMLKQEAALRETLNIGQDIMKRCHPDAVSTMKHWLGVLRARWEELTGLSKLRQKRLTEALTNARLNSTLLEELLAWLNTAEVKLTEVDREPIPKDLQIIQELITEHQDFQNEMSAKQPSVDRLTKADKRKAGSDPITSHIPVFRKPRSGPRSKIPKIRVDYVDGSGRKTPDFFGRRTPEHFSGRKTPDVSGRKTPDVSGRMTPDRSGRKTPDYLSGRRTPEPGFNNPRVGALFNKWRQVWLMAMYRQRKLQDALDYLNELERLKNFDFEEWRKRYLRWMNHNKARIMDFFRRQDRDRDGRVTRQEFIDGILVSKFPTSRPEMEAVADIFDKDKDGYINYKEFVAALRPDRDPRPETDSEKIMDEVRRQVSRCTCVKQFKIHKIGEGKYRFGDSQKLRLVRILRSTVMVRVGGGWIALDEFLVKNDPCRAKGRTNVELRENFILAEGVSQSMAGFISKSPAGSSHSSSSSYSGRSHSTASGPVTKIREKTVPQTPWRQKTKISPDGEVHEIMSHTESDGTKVVKHKVTQELRSPRNVASPASRSSSRASTGSGSRPPSQAGSEAPDDNQEVFTTMQTDKRNVGGRTDTTVTYQTHSVQTRNVTLPTVTTTKISRIPKVTPSKKK